MQALGSRAALGRSLTPDDATGDGRIAVLSHEFWRRRFGRDPTVIGRRLMLNGVAFTVAGVMPEEFEFPSAGGDLWRAGTDDQIGSNERRSHNWFVIAVLGGTLGVAAATVLTRVLLALAPTNIPRLAAVHVDAGVLAFGLLMTVASGLLFGLAPAVRLVTADRVRGPSLHLALRAAG